MKNKLRSLLPAIAVLIVGAGSASADTKNYSWSGAATPTTLPPVYADSSSTPLPTYEMANSRLHAASPGYLGSWTGKQFDWDGNLADNEMVSGSIKFRVNSIDNGADGLQRVRLFTFNAPWANGLHAFMLLYGMDKKTSRPPGWGPGLHSEWNKWEYNPGVTNASAPPGQVYVYNSFNMNDPATDADFFRAIYKGTDHVLSWSAQYDSSNDVVTVTTALDGVPWTVTCVGRQFYNLDWNENALAKAWPNMGSWDAEYSAINWATTTVPAPTGDTRNYSWYGLSGGFPPVYVDSSSTPLPLYDINWQTGRLQVASPGYLGSWTGKQFDWVGNLADNEKVSGALKFRVNSIDNGADGLQRVRLFTFNAPWANGLHAFMFLYGMDKRTSRPPGWGPGLHSEWNKWEYNPGVTNAAAPPGQIYVYNSFNMNDPATDADFFRAIDKGTDHVLSWSAQYDTNCDVVKVTTALDGVAWTVTCVGRQFYNLDWNENALAKAWPNMGSWDAEYSAINWATTTVPAPAVPADTKNYSWNGLSGCFPPVYVDSSSTILPTYETSWQVGQLHVGNTNGGNGNWTGKQFDWVGDLADNEAVSGSVKFRINSYTNAGITSDPFQRVRLFAFNGGYANGLRAFMMLYGSDKQTTKNSGGGWHAGGNSEWGKWEYNPSDAGPAAPPGQTYVYNSFNMNDPATNPDFFRAVTNGTDHVLSWSAQYMASDVVRVTTALDGVPWTVTDVGRQFLNLDWPENALAKQWPNMGGWDAEYSAINWATTPAAPSISISRLPSGQAELKWLFGTLLEAADITGPWLPVSATSPHTITLSGQKFYRAQ